MYKLIDIVLNDRLTAHLNDGYYRLNSTQTGFRQRIGCEVNILRLSETIRQLKPTIKPGQNLWTLFIDFKSAFDNTSQISIFQKLKKLDVERALCNSVKWLYGQTEMFNGRDISLINKGVIQGGTLSPTLFTVFMDELLIRLDKAGYHVFAYADDIAITGSGEKKLLKAWQTIWNWQLDSEMRVNRKKSGIMLHKGTLKKLKVIDGQKVHKKSGIPLVETYKYLGVLFDRAVNFKAHIEYVREKIQKPLKILSIMRWKRCPKWHQVYSWLTYIAPHFRYGALVYYQQNGRGQFDSGSAKFRKLQQLYNATVKQAFKLPPKGNTAVVNGLLGTASLQNTIMRSYSTNAIKWQKCYRNDIGDKKTDIGYEMDCNLDAILRQLHLTRKRAASSKLFDEQVIRNAYGNAGWSPMHQLKRSDSLLKVVQWQAKAKTRRHGQNQLCKFCGQTVGIWGHYATCAKRPNSLVDIETRIYFESSRTVTLADILYDPGCVKLIDRNYYGITTDGCRPRAVERPLPPIQNEQEENEIKGGPKVTHGDQHDQSTKAALQNPNERDQNS